MLVELQIRNLAIIDQLQVQFAAGFNVLTGETGAGKSIIIDAVGLLLGDRARPELIRNGADEASVEALLDLSGQAGLQQELQQAGFDGEGELLVRRVVSRAGKNRVYVNGSLATLAQLQAFSGQLVTIYGQHEHQTLQRGETHLALLDSFAGHGPLLLDYATHYAAHRQLQQRLDGLEAAERDRQQRLEVLAFQQREIAAVAPVPGEDEELAAERLLLQHAERLATTASGGFETLYGGEAAVCGELARVAADLEGLAAIDPLLGSLGESLRSAQYSVEDCAAQLRDYRRRIEFEPQRQEEVESRLAQLSPLKRKYGPTIAAVLEHRDQVERELAELGDLAATREELMRQLDAAAAALRQSGKQLSCARSAAAARLSQAVEAELADLALAKARFVVQLFPLAAPGSQGLERVEFYLAPNPGEEPKPLARIASGGELSRIMLALRRAAPMAEGVQTLIFDEVDAGVGGAAATAVGEKLRKVARGLQVLCITHLPQVAAFADHHFRVEKSEVEGRTVTTILPLDDTARVGEMARMLGGARVTERTLEHARELIGQSCRA
ncbi:DNA repair ATPase RecN [Desulfuromonas sp. DDH964]|uniref:DNA repair protein RecN n=1 Tax=Desulfuromonas sp. DDH964 TaxID=1823759 RepID=UPI00078EC32F|nr:DNA repair protein RecN [Desulfuromonas sp. DDH964]AMV72977.1 DNA repair ATPase RecN [Desulfuromonas sp. DDH964]